MIEPLPDIDTSSRTCSQVSPVVVTSVDTKDHINEMVNHNKDNEFHLLLSTEKLIEKPKDDTFCMTILKNYK